MEVITSNGEKVYTGNAVLVRDGDEEIWIFSHFSHFVADNHSPYVVGHGVFFSQCIRYAGNESLEGTADSMPRNKEHFRFGDKVKVRDNAKDDWEEAVYLEFRKDFEPFPYRVVLKESSIDMECYRYCRHADW